MTSRQVLHLGAALKREVLKAKATSLQFVGSFARPDEDSSVFLRPFLFRTLGLHRLQ